MMLGFAVEGKIFIFCAGLGSTTKLNPSPISQLGHTKPKVASICLVKSTTFSLLNENWASSTKVFADCDHQGKKGGGLPV
jgi:hypothetical protein